MLVQVRTFVGADVENGLGPAPLECVDARFAEQVPRQKPHLRHGYPTPAPMLNELKRMLQVVL